MTIFDILNDIIKHKTGKLADDPEFEKKFNPYFVIRYLSMHKKYEKYAFKLNNYPKQKYVSKRDIYFMLINMIPKSNDTYIKYIKKPKVEESED